jgi:fructan beta-fructosidase
MSGEEPYRPRRHFSPRSGWMNDPNGLIHVDGTWHMFYQHHPDSTQWGPMHWGHASSTDLVRWTEHPIALRPDALGTCFSGSAIETPEGEIKLFYTAHLARPDGSVCESQCLVHADRALTRFTAEAANPIVANPGLASFRDPKLFRHEATGRWIMVLTHGQAIAIRSSADLIDWRLESVFGETEGRHGAGPWECPDLVPLVAPDGTTHWIMIVGIGSDAYGGGSGTQYFIGQFDGHRFVNANPPETVLWMDHGRDYYAAQSFFGAARPTVLAWASNWHYAAALPTRAFRGVMSLPRELGLAPTPAGLRLRQRIPAAVAESFAAVASGQRPASGTYRCQVDFGDAQRVAVTLFGESEPQFVVTRRGAATTLLTRRDAPRSIAGFAHAYEVELAPASGIELFVDNGLVELCTSDGLVFVTSLYFPADPAGEIRIEAR